VSGAAQVVVAAWTGLSCNRPHMAQPSDDRVNRHLEDCGPEPGAVDTVGARNSAHLVCDLLILVNQPAEPVASSDVGDQGRGAIG
jgi:hypothetical protein